MGKFIKDIGSWSDEIGKFVDREPLIREFWDEYYSLKDSIKKAKEAAQKKERVTLKAYVLNYYGIAGIGKSRLIEKLEDEIKNGSKEHDKAKVVRHDFAIETDSFKVIESLSQKLKDDYKFNFYRLNKGLAAYHEVIGESVDKFKQKGILENHPKAGVIVKALSLGLAESLDTHLTYLINETDNNYEKELEIFKDASKNKRLERLMFLFIKDLEENLQKEEKPLIIMFDTYEMLVNEMKGTGKPTNADEWLRGGVNFEKALIPNTHGVLWVIGGREELKWKNFDDDWETGLHKHSLEKLPEEFVKEYLNNAGISDEKLCEDLYKLTEGVPIYLHLCVIQYESLKNRNIVPDIDKFGRTIKQLTDRYVRDMNEDIKKIVRILSCLNCWTDDMAEDIIKKTGIIFDRVLYKKIKNFSFINNVPPSKIYSINRIVRDAILADEDFDEESKKKIAGYVLDYCKNKIEIIDFSSSSDYTFYIKQLMEYALQYFEDNEELWEFYCLSIFEKLNYLKSIGRTANLKLPFDGFCKRFKESNNELLCAKALNNFSAFYYDDGNYSKALELLECVIKIFEKYPEYEEKYFRARLDEINCLNESGKHYRALRESDELWIDVQNSKCFLNSPNLWFDIHINEIIIQINYGKFKLAEDNIRDIIVILGVYEALPEQFSKLIKLRSLLVLALTDQKKYPEAILEGEKLMTDCVNEYGTDAPQTLNVKSELATAYCAAINIGDARLEGVNPEEVKEDAYFKQALSLIEEVVNKLIENSGESHPKTIHLMNSLSILYKASADYVQALKWGEKALDSLKKRKNKLNKDQLESLAIINNMKDICDKAGLNDKKLEIEKEGKKIQANMIDATSYYDEGKFKEAFESFKKGAAEGYTFAKNYLGLIYYYGKGVKKNYEEAFKWFKQAAEEGDSESQYRLGLMYLTGEGIGKEDRGEGIWWICQAARNGELRAISELAILAYDGTIPDMDTNTIIDWLKFAAENGIGSAQVSLGIIYLTDKNLQNFEEAFKWFKQAAEQGNGGGQYCLGQMILDGSAGEKNIEEALKWLKQAAENGNDKAQVSLFKIYYSGLYDVEKNIVEAVKWIKQAAEQGNSEGQFLLAVLYLDEYGVKHNDWEGVRWLRQASAQGNAMAEYRLGLLYMQGGIIEKNFEEARRLITKSAEHGNSIAFFTLMDMYNGGIISREGWIKIIELFKKAADQGLKEAQFALAKCYEEGLGISQDEQKAFEWYKKAAELGYKEAQSALAVCYEEGVGVSQDEQKAFECYKKAAELGDVDAQFEIAERYELGCGTEKDEEEAFKWYKKSAEQGNKYSQEKLAKFHR